MNRSTEMSISPASRLSPGADWNDPAALTLAADGRIALANGAAERMFDYAFGELLDLHVSQLLPALTETAITREGDFRHLRYLSHCGLTFAARSGNGRDFPCNLSFVTLGGAANGFVRVIVTAPEIGEFGRA